MENNELFLRLGVALGIGFMIGLQREFAFRGLDRKLIAGERTFALMGLTGALAAMAADALGSPLAFLGALLLVGVLGAIAYFVDAWRGEVGLTTEITILLVMLLGALCYWGYLMQAVAAAIAVAVVLSLKIETDRLVQALTREDILAALKLAVISAIVLPVLPNENPWPPPFDVLNPFKIWLMVVFISAISFLGYLSIKLVGAERGIGLTGLLGGLASSTAVSLSFSERSNREENLARPFALAITIAWTVMFARVLIEVGVLNQPLLRAVWPPIVAAGLVGLLYCVYLFFSQRTAEKNAMEFSNPLDLKTAIQFGLLYGVILLVARTAQYYFGTTGVLISSVLAGLADVDAITLTLAELNNAGGLNTDIARLAVVLATMSNTVVKGSIVMIGGSKALRKVMLPGLLLMLVTGVLMALLT